MWVLCSLPFLQAVFKNGVESDVHVWNCSMVLSLDKSFNNASFIIFHLSSVISLNLKLRSIYHLLVEITSDLNYWARTFPGVISWAVNWRGSIFLVFCVWQWLLDGAIQVQPSPKSQRLGFFFEVTFLNIVLLTQSAKTTETEYSLLIQTFVTTSPKCISCCLSPLLPCHMVYLDSNCTQLSGYLAFLATSFLNSLMKPFISSSVPHRYLNLLKFSPIACGAIQDLLFIIDMTNFKRNS